MSFFDRLLNRARSPAPDGGVSVDLFDEDFLRRLESLSIMSRRATSGVRRGERRSKKRGGGVEFADHRPYVPGDDIRFLDIGVYQRFGKLLLRLFEEEEDLSLYFLIDSSASMGVSGSKKLNQAVRVCAALAYVGLTGLDRVSISALSDHVVRRLAPTRGKQRVFHVLRFLSEIKTEGRTDLAQAAKTFIAQNPRRGVAVLLSDLYDPQGFEAGINVLRFAKFEPVVMELSDFKEQQLVLSGDLLLSDVETGDSREVSMTPALLEKLKETMAGRRSRIANFCASRGVPYFTVDVDADFDEIVLSVLKAGGLLR